MDNSAFPSTGTLLLLGTIFEEACKQRGLDPKEVAKHILQQDPALFQDLGKEGYFTPTMSSITHPYKCPKCVQRFKTSDVRNGHAKGHGG